MSDAMVPDYNDAQIALSEDLQETVNRTREYIQAARSQNTHRVYSSSWKLFVEWCVLKGLEDLPATPQTVALYIGNMASRSRKPAKPATIALHLAAIRMAHRAHDLETPTSAWCVEEAMAGIRRTHGSDQTMKDPATAAVIRKMVESLPAGLVGKRDRALLLIGFAGAFRRSELVSLNREDIRFTERGLEVTLRGSKTDKEHHGDIVRILSGKAEETCPVAALRAWCAAAGITSGPLFRSFTKYGTLRGRLCDRAVAEIIKEHAGSCGLDKVHFSGHSLRAGYVTSAAEADIPERIIQQQTRHKGVMMLRRYIRGVDMWKECPDVGL